MNNSMSIERAIRLLHPDTTIEAIAEIEEYNGLTNKPAAIAAINDACKIACVSMEKDVAKSIKYNRNYKRNELEYYTFWCPTCEQNIVNLNVYHKYCPNCGQKLNWEIPR